MPCGAASQCLLWCACAAGGATSSVPAMPALDPGLELQRLLGSVDFDTMPQEQRLRWLLSCSTRIFGEDRVGAAIGTAARQMQQGTQHSLGQPQLSLHQLSGQPPAQPCLGKAARPALQYTAGLMPFPSAGSLQRYPALHPPFLAPSPRSAAATTVAPAASATMAGSSQAPVSADTPATSCAVPALPQPEPSSPGRILAAPQLAGSSNLLPTVHNATSGERMGTRPGHALHKPASLLALPVLPSSRATGPLQPGKAPWLSRASSRLVPTQKGAAAVVSAPGSGGSSDEVGSMGFSEFQVRLCACNITMSICLPWGSGRGAHVMTSGDIPHMSSCTVDEGYGSVRV